MSECVSSVVRTCKEECKTQFHMVFIATADLYLHTNGLKGLHFISENTGRVITANMKHATGHISPQNQED